MKVLIVRECTVNGAAAKPGDILEVGEAFELDEIEVIRDARPGEKTRVVMRAKGDTPN